jgi:hypothetical protein
MVLAYDIYRMKHLTVYESYTAANADYLPVVTNIPNFKEDYESLAEQFLGEIRKDYITGKDKPYDKKYGDDSWYTQEFFRWCELLGIPVKVMYFQGNEKIDDHVAIFLDEYIIDFTYKKISGNPKDNYYVGDAKEYLKYGYKEDKVDILEEFPSWIERYNQPIKKK